MRRLHAGALHGMLGCVSKLYLESFRVVSVSAEVKSHGHKYCVLMTVVLRFSLEVSACSGWWRLFSGCDWK